MTGSTPLQFALIAGAAAAGSAAVIWLALKAGAASLFLDKPNERSLHVTPTPRLGGVCLIAVALAVAVFAGAGDLLPVLGVGAFLAIVSVFDDIRSLPAYVRFGSHLLAAVAIVWIYPLPQAWLLAMAVIYIAWHTNLYNFMDGMDGFSGGMAVLGFGAFGIAALQSGAMTLGVVSVSVTGAALGFLAFNFPPARVFMGDAGAIPLGFLAAALSYLGYRGGVWPWWFGPFVFSPFIVDASVTLLRRIFAGEKVWAAHRSHYYQRMAQSGLGHFATTMRWYVLMIAVVICALYFRDRAPAEIAGLGAVWAAIYLAAMLWIDRLWPRQKVSG
jgi:UDP-N-acetylmuramyl pentapeptide phosphotransferase/UDP-N-acetylglucosamine-1-phosphate transferase